MLVGNVYVEDVLVLEMAMVACKPELGYQEEDCHMQD